MTDLTDLVTRCQNALANAGAFSSGLVTEWLEDGIREYSQHFDITVTTTITTAADDHEYTLDGAGLVLSVEYPVDEDPPEYLTQRDYRSAAFWENDDSYDVLQVGDGSVELRFSNSFDADESVDVIHTRVFDEDAATVEIPPEHEPLLIEYVTYKAWQYLASAEMQDPTSNSSLLMAQLNQNAKDAQRKYLKLLALAMFEEEGQSAVIHWKMDKYDQS